ncbi:putative Calcipressin-2 [Hypsibius exemplaris]|uniref:Calcipressin-2 n=1 Tax=Hypsibius exemplaris TaxID=2072580 RepID=A0A1W0WEX8_HYPEX|nr:putative Calcipressin-2 [Hypsibius exemplaris]
MYDNDVEFTDLSAESSEKNHNKRKRDLRKLNSAGGSTDSEDISEASSTASLGDERNNGEVSEATSSILITNMDAAIFTDRDVMEMFENLLRKYDPNVRVLYFKSFSRARADMSSVLLASSAKEDLTGLQFGGKVLKCFFFRDLLLGRRNSDHLELPPLEKQFLISPPVSPPVGWEPVQEGEPVMDYELLTALASLQPGESHELHPGVQSQNIPSIYLQPCETDEGLPSSVSDSPDYSDAEETLTRRKGTKVQILQTRRPPV